jgi:hypothetical protein
LVRFELLVGLSFEIADQLPVVVFLTLFKLIGGLELLVVHLLGGESGLKDFEFGAKSVFTTVVVGLGVASLHYRG